MNVLEARTALKLLAIFPVGAELIVQTAFFVILQNFIRLVDIFKALFRACVTGIEVGVIFAGELLVGFGNFILARSSFHAEKLVVILVCYSHAHSPVSEGNISRDREEIRPLPPLSIL